MGKYINENSKGILLPATGKLEALIADGAVLTNDATFQKNLVCVVENGFFDAALFLYDYNEYEYVINNPDPRKKYWVVYPYAEKLAK